MNIFNETWSETKRMSSSLLCATSSTCTLSLRLPEGLSCIVISVFISLSFLHCWYPCNFVFKKVSYTFRFSHHSFRLCSKQPWFTPTEKPGVSAELCSWFFCILKSMIKLISLFQLTHDINIVTLVVHFYCLLFTTSVYFNFVYCDILNNVNEINSCCLLVF